MKVSQRTLMITAAIIWYGGGISLLFKGGALIKNVYAIDTQSIWAYLAPILGIMIGLLKGRFLFSKSCEKNINRIKALSNPRIWQCFRPGVLIFLAIIIPTGAWMSRAAAGNLHVSVPGGRPGFIDCMRAAFIKHCLLETQGLFIFR